MVEHAEAKGLAAAGKGLTTAAQEMIGTEDEDWPALADATVAEKSRLGYTNRISPTDPLYRTGELRISISYTVDANGVTLGSTDPIAPFQEDGTHTIPARPFISATLFRHGHAAADLVADYLMGGFMGLRRPLGRTDGKLPSDTGLPE